MSIKQFKPYTPGRRQMTIQGREDITADKPERSLTCELRKHGGRNNTGRITMRHIGGGHRRAYRIIDFRRDKIGVPGKVATIRSGAAGWRVHEALPGLAGQPAQQLPAPPHRAR